MMSRSRKFVRSPARTGCVWKRSVMPLVFQLMTMLTSVKSEMQLSSVKPKLRQRPAVLRREIGQVVGELVQPIDAGTRAR